MTFRHAMGFFPQDPMTGTAIGAHLQQENNTIQPQLLSTCPTTIEHPCAPDPLLFPIRLGNNGQVASGHNTNYPTFESHDRSAGSLLLPSQDALQHGGNPPPKPCQILQQPSGQHQANRGKQYS